MGKILTRLWIVLERREREPLGGYYIYRKMNPYNPLTWVFILVAVPISIFQGGYNRTQESLKDVFKWK